jgi:hypothetical protein
MRNHQKQAKTQKKSTSKTQFQPKFAQNATTDYFQKLTSAAKTHQKQMESFNPNLNLNADAIYAEKEGVKEGKWEDDIRYNRNLDTTEFNFTKTKNAKEGAIHIAQKLLSDRALFAIIYNFIEKAENAMEILAREDPSLTSTTKARTSKRILEDVYKHGKRQPNASIFSLKNERACPNTKT